MSEGGARLTAGGRSDRSLPLLTIRRYSAAAVRRAVAKQYEDGTWLVEVPGLAGTWAHEETLDKAREALADVIFQWAILKIEDRDRNLPVIDGMNLNLI